LGSASCLDYIMLVEVRPIVFFGIWRSLSDSISVCNIL